MTAATSNNHEANNMPREEQAGESFQRELQQEMEEMQQQQQQQQPQEEEEEEESDVEVKTNVQMQLTEQEKRWTIQLKQAALRKKDNDDDEEEDGVLPLVSDFEYAQWAMVYQEDTEAALRSLELCIQFRQQYGIDDSVEQGLHYLHGLMEQQPGLLLHMDVTADGEPVKVCDPGVLNPKAALGNGGRDWNIFVVGMYYFHLACQPNLLAVRQGASMLLDFGDVDSTNMSVDVQYQLFAELCSWYPIEIKAFMAFHTGFGATMRLSLVKAVLPKCISSKIQLGCEIDGEDAQTQAEDGSTINRLRQFYLVPTLQEAQHNTLLKAKSLLETRYENDRTFQLVEANDNEHVATMG